MKKSGLHFRNFNIALALLAFFIAGYYANSEQFKKLLIRTETINIAANEGWHKTNIKIKPGQTVTFEADGQWTADQRSAPAHQKVRNNLFGWVDADGNKDLPAWEQCAGDICAPIMSLMGKVDKETFVIGRSLTKTFVTGGELEMTPNDLCCMGDNAGEMIVKLTIE